MAVIATLAVKLQAQIAEFQSEFREAAKSTEKFQQEFQTTATKASAYGNLIARGLEIGISAAKQLGEAALENASKIDDLSKKTGLSMRTIQEFQHVAGETGTTVDAWANAAFRLGTNLSGGSANVVKGVKDLGLEFAQLKKQDIDGQFRTVIQALEDMDDQQEANRIGVLLFGRTYREMAVAVAEGYSDLAKGARIMSDESVKRLADAEDAWKRLGRTSVIISGEILAATIETVDKATSSWSNFFRFLAAGLPGTGFKTPVFPVPDPNKGLTPEQIAFDTSFNALFKKQQAERAEAARKALEDVDVVMRKVRKSTNEFADALQRTDEELAKADFKSLADDIKLVDEHTTDTAKSFEEAAKRAKEMGEDLQSLRDDISDVDSRMAAFAEQMEEGFKSEDIKSLKDDIAAVAQVVETPPDMSKWQQRFEDLKNDLKNIGFDAAHTFAEGLAEGIRTGDWGAVGQAFENAMADALASGMAAAVDFLVPGLGQALRPLFQAISEKITGLFDFNEGRDLVEDFAKSLGGFDALQDRLALLGDEGARLWRMLTQGVGRDNPAQAQAAIDAVTAALERQQEAWIELGKKIGDLAETAIGSGELLDASMIPFINQLLTAGVITDDLAAKLLLMTSENSANWREMEALAKKYGIELSGLGATFQQQKLTDTAAEIIRDFDRLINNGADFNAVLQGMSDEINDVVIESLKFGTEIPENMRPWIQALIDSGRLLDDTGAKITNIDTLKFGPAVKSDIDELTEAIRDLIKALGVTLPAAARAGAAGLQREFDGIKIAPIRVPVEFDTGGLHLPEGWNVPAMQHGGIVRRPTLALIGEAGPEAVVPLSQLGAVSSRGTSTVIFEVAGQRIARATVPYLPGEIRRYVPA